MITDRIKGLLKRQKSLDEIPSLDLNQAAINCLFKGADPRQEALEILINREFLSQGTVLPTEKNPNPGVDKIVNDLTTRMYESF